jgi:GntR family transcriptional repressor for pyruvate dehydrogenase complex
MSDKISSAKRARRLPDTIAEYLMATARELAPGSKLPSENQLARKFGVSRSAVREAVSGVESLGLLEIRTGLDAAAARVAAIRRTAEEVKFLREMTVTASRPDLAIPAVVEADLAFHLAIVRATQNEYFVSIQTFLLDHLRAGILFTRTLESYSKEKMEEVRREHSEIFQAIEARNADLASRLAEQHVLNARRRMRSAFASHVMPDLG